MAILRYMIVEKIHWQVYSHSYLAFGSVKIASHQEGEKTGY